MRDVEILRLLWDRALEIWPLTPIELEKSQSREAIRARVAIAVVALSAGVGTESIRRGLGLRKKGAYVPSQVMTRHREFMTDDDGLYRRSITEFCGIVGITGVDAPPAQTARDRVRRKRNVTTLIEQ